MKMSMIALVALVLAVIAGGCANLDKTQNGALLGAGAGALAGQGFGGDTKSTLIGAGIGGLGGALVGNQVQKSEDNARAQAYNQGYHQGYGQGTYQNQPIAYGGRQEPPSDGTW